MKSSNPYAARVVAEIDIHQALDAIEHFAENYPDDRQSQCIATRLRLAADTIMRKAQALVALKPMSSININHYGATSGRYDSSKPNQANIHKENCNIGYADMMNDTVTGVSSRAWVEHYCNVCKATSPIYGPMLHRTWCSRYGVGLSKVVA